jgi:hypothetical protein
MSKVYVFIYRPLERFDDGVDVGRFIGNGNKDSEIVISPRNCQIYVFISRNCRNNIVDQQVALL